MQDKQARHPDEIEQYSLGYKGVKQGVAEGLNEFAQSDFNGGNDSNDLQLYLNVAKKLNMKKYKPSTAHDLIAKKMAELVDVVDDDKVDYARHMARKAQGLPNMLEQGVAEGLNEFAMDDGNNGEDPTDNYPCYDCGSTIFLHHTKLCDLAEPNAKHDLPARPGSQHWTGEIPKGLHPIPGLQEDVAENFIDGRHPEDKGDSKRYGVPTKASISTLRKVAKQGGRKGQLAHWMANMKSGHKK
jgi:hypothetical protein